MSKSQQSWPNIISDIVCKIYLSRQDALSEGFPGCQRKKLTPVGFEPTPLRTGAWSQHLRPLGQSVHAAQGIAFICGKI